jgi:hypothetical protein
MISNRRIGDSVTLAFEVRKPDGTLTDADVTLVVNRPDGTAAAFSISHPAVGRYEAVLGLSQAGLWSWRWSATGAATAASDGVLRVEALLAPDLYVTPEELRADLGDIGAMSKVDPGRVVLACRAASRAVDRWCSAAAPGYRRFWLDPVATSRAYSPAGDPYVLDIADVASIAEVTVSGVVWAPGVDYQAGPADAAAQGRPYEYLEALAATWPVPTSTWAAFSGRPPVTRPALPAVVVLGRHGWPEQPPEARLAARIYALRLFKRPGAPYGTEGVTDWGPVRIARNDPDIAPLLEPLSLGPVLA